MSGIYIFLGPPGAGKGTIGEVFCEKTGAVHVSTGQLLRDEMAAGSALGNQVKELIASGALVSDEIVTAMVASRLAKEDVREKGALLDGYPRTVQQATSLDGILAKQGLPAGAAVLVDAPREELLKRLTGRRMCSNKACGAIYNIYHLPPKVEGKCDRCQADLYQRSDDTEETVKSRLEVYDRQTAPVIDYYRGKGRLQSIENAGASAAEVCARLMRQLGL